MLSVHLLGTPNLIRDGMSLDAVRRKNRAVIYYLAANARPLARETLQTLFWLDLDRAQAQKVLRTTLYDLRKSLGDALVSDDEYVSLAPDVEVDALQFEAALAQPSNDPAALEATLALYRGDFLHGFALPDAPNFDDWVTRRREHFRELAMRGFVRMAKLRERAGDYGAALASLSMALAFDPLQEDVQREALRLHYLNGDRAGAIRRYESLRRMLDEELGVPPSNETRALYDAIITDALPSPAGVGTRASAPSQTPSPNPGEAALAFTGRGAELRTLLADASAGKFVLIEGEPGIGKTRLAETLIDSLRARAASHSGAIVLRGAAHELEQGLPYQPVIDALRDLLASPDWTRLRTGLNLAPVWLGEVARLLPELRDQLPGMPAESASLDESRLWEGVARFLQALARNNSLILFLDDLHWADASTLGLLAYLARRATAIVCIGTTRQTRHPPLTQLLSEITREDRLSRVALAPLSVADMRAVANRLSQTHGDLLSEWLTNNAEGNPYFVTELVRYARRNDLLRDDGWVNAPALIQSLTLPPTIHNLIASRVLKLSDNARRVMHTAAVLGREFEFDLLRRAVALPEAEIFDALDALRAAALIQPSSGERFAFDHSLTVEVARQDMGEARLRAMHRHVGETLECIRPQPPDMAGLIAFHYLRGHAPERAAPHALSAGKQAARLAAWAEAIAFYESALAADIDDALRAEALLHCGEARFHNGDFARSSEDHRASLGFAQAAGNFALMEEAHQALVRSLLPQARYDEAIALSRALREGGPAELAACAEFGWGAALAVQSAQPKEAERHLREAMRLLDEPRAFTSKITRAQITYQLGAVMGQQGRSAEAVALYREAIELSKRNDGALDTLRSIMVYNNLAHHLNVLNDPSAAEAAREGIRRAEEKGSLSHLPYLLSTSGEIALGKGELDTAEKYFSDGLALAEHLPIPERVVGLTANLGRVAHARGQTDLAVERFSDVLAQADALGAKHMAAQIRTWLAPLSPTSHARQLLREARAIAEAGGYHTLLEEIARQEAELPAAPG